MTLWILFALGAAILWTLVNLADKYIIGHECRDPLIATTTLSTIHFTVFSLVAVFTRTELHTDPLVLFYAFMIGALITITNFLYYRSLSGGDVSKVVPLFSTAPLFALILGAVFLGERFSPHAYVGVTLITIGAVVISMKRLKHHLALEPIAFAALAVALASAIRSVLFKSAGVHATTWELLFWIGVFTLVTAIPLILAHHVHLSDFKNTLFRKGFEHFLITDTLNALGFLSLFVALSLGPITLVTAILHTKPLVVFVLAMAIDVLWPSILREKMTKRLVLQKTIGTILIVIGAFLVIR